MPKKRSSPEQIMTLRRRKANRCLWPAGKRGYRIRATTAGARNMAVLTHDGRTPGEIV